MTIKMRGVRLFLTKTTPIMIRWLLEVRTRTFCSTCDIPIKTFPGAWSIARFWRVQPLHAHLDNSNNVDERGRRVKLKMSKWLADKLHIDTSDMCLHKHSNKVGDALDSGGDLDMDSEIAVIKVHSFMHTPIATHRHNSHHMHRSSHFATRSHHRSFVCACVCVVFLCTILFSRRT